MAQQNLKNRVVCILGIAVLLVMTMSKVSWANQLTQHDTAPLAKPAIIALEHGHYHTPVLDHVHEHSSDFSADDHSFIHAVKTLDHQVFLLVFPERPQNYTNNLFIPISLNPLPPYLRGPYRPPRQT